MTNDPVASGGESQPVDKDILHRGLKIIRRRRWYLWLIILVYMPLMLQVMKKFPSMKVVSAFFIGWFVFMFAIALFAAVARCPRCGNYFHVNGMTLLYLRKCLHCQLHLTADKRL